jgi:hypothetical protein
MDKEALFGSMLRIRPQVMSGGGRSAVTGSKKAWSLGGALRGGSKNPANRATATSSNVAPGVAQPQVAADSALYHRGMKATPIKGGSLERRLKRGELYEMQPRGVVDVGRASATEQLALMRNGKNIKTTKGGALGYRRTKGGEYGGSFTPTTKGGTATETLTPGRQRKWGMIRRAWDPRPY